MSVEAQKWIGFKKFIEMHRSDKHEEYFDAIHKDDLKMQDEVFNFRKK